MQGTYRTAFITGASSGIGRGLAAWLARRGVRVFGAARRLEELEALAREVQSEGEIVPVQLDVADARSTLEVIRSIDESCGGLELVVANAAIAPETPGHALAWDTVEQIIDVNVRGAAATLGAVADRMVSRGSGHLVGISSQAAGRGLPRHVAYSASKAFLSNFIEGLRVDLGPRGVKVTAIHPGFVRTPGTAGNAFKMPFLLEVDDAVDRIGRAIFRGASDFSFPWQAATVSKLSRLLPNGLWDRAVRGFGTPGD
ncbi:SDR family NAD(P)-dependent oxidoreductase [Hyalangium rubrum]|uniref:SDR family NAD(P)-dependent oxidoreductase n=1 Tax=Hyalangium rubrum TaxID=3103134 RepID=A0ABU5GWM5_9BACT|nr:SDR family NAD(P)-dependent oxidoreductase [Hyalangium sp. s54d21]MDY7225589.1 SDR family NAD(P)-dependent oxidoreductase [Hyalangium sp. s54d21]